MTQPDIPPQTPAQGKTDQPAARKATAKQPTETSQPSARSEFDLQLKVERARAWTGLLAVVTSDLVILGATAFALYLLRHSNETNLAPLVTAVLTSAFTTIGTLTTAYFGIRAIQNTAQKSIEGHRSATADG